MSDINVQNTKTIQNKVPQQKVAPLYSPKVATQNITSNNGYLPTYSPVYYTSHIDYKTPNSQMKYPTNEQTTATISTGGQTYEVKPGSGGVNIILNSPTVAAPGSHPLINTNTNCSGANDGISQQSPYRKRRRKTKNVVAITNDYVKNLENYIRHPNKALKIDAVKQLSKRFMEDESRKTNPSLNALLNLALQTKDKTVRAVALSLLTSGYAGGNDETVKLLTNMQQSTVFQGEEANDAKKALLRMSETVVKVPDDSPVKVVRDKEDDYFYGYD